ncbi:MAG: YidC/Oxa1 family membrane protein insertase [Pseudomonadales bacterium]|nr:YidC/Oxa1 family membrane protein insertase [Candidatus Woesebacteria bacterium]MCB9801469.1 YidC/Oxa1 family membrane protein insertase [Pseudomonadales bacterium]
MMSFFITLVYQPLFNALLFFYWLLDKVGIDDMGVAVILLTLVVRIILLPLSLRGDSSEEERREIASHVKNIEETYRGDPIKQREERKKLMRSRRKIISAELISFSIQLVVSLMLWKIFATGLSGQDWHLVYGFMPDIPQPLNLNFLGIFDLTHSSWRLNILQSFLIFVLETLSIFTSPFLVSRNEVVRLQLVLPLVSFLIFLRLPAGKKLFIITSLLFSIVLTLIKAIRLKFVEYKDKEEHKTDDEGETIVVSVG